MGEMERGEPNIDFVYFLMFTEINFKERSKCFVVFWTKTRKRTRTIGGKYSIQVVLSFINSKASFLVGTKVPR